MTQDNLIARLRAVPDLTFYDSSAIALEMSKLATEAADLIELASMDPVRQVAMELREALRDIVDNATFGEISLPRLDRARSALASADAVMGEVEAEHDTV